MGTGKRAGMMPHKEVARPVTSGISRNASVYRFKGVLLASVDLQPTFHRLRTG